MRFAVKMNKTGNTFIIIIILKAETTYTILSISLFYSAFILFPLILLFGTCLINNFITVERLDSEVRGHGGSEVKSFFF